MHKLTSKTKSKSTRSKTIKISNISSKSKIHNYKWNTIMPLEKLIALWNKIYTHGINNPQQNDPETEHSLEDDILIKFILEVENGTIRDKEITRIARMIKTHILDKRRVKWYAG